MLRTFGSVEVRAAKLATEPKLATTLKQTLKLATTLKLALKMGSSLKLNLPSNQYLTIMIWSERREHSLVFV